MKLQSHVQDTSDASDESKNKKATTSAGTVGEERGNPLMLRQNSQEGNIADRNTNRKNMIRYPDLQNVPVVTENGTAVV